MLLLTNCFHVSHPMMYLAPIPAYKGWVIRYQGFAIPQAPKAGLCNPKLPKVTIHCRSLFTILPKLPKLPNSPGSPSFPDSQGPPNSPGSPSSPYSPSTPSSPDSPSTPCFTDSPSSLSFPNFSITPSLSLSLKFEVRNRHFSAYLLDKLVRCSALAS